MDHREATAGRLDVAYTASCTLGCNRDVMAIPLVPKLSQ